MQHSRWVPDTDTRVESGHNTAPAFVTNAQAPRSYPGGRSILMLADSEAGEYDPHAV
ncbi:MAG: hypothetical protein SH809_15010 [Rhodothermales bacterium]|nr:hypothetical protein [Rhodothermales bacterium]